MSSETVPVSIRVLDKEYMISCSEDEKEALLESARVLNERMRQVRDSGKVLGTERMAVVTALNVIYESTQERHRLESHAASTAAEIRRIEDKIGRALAGSRRPERERLD